MKIIRRIIVGAAFLMPWLMLSDVRAADVSVGVEINSPDDFYEPLSAQGSWVEVGSYGRCWHPYGVAASWRPYCNGTWVWTDEGWYWQSDEAWSWACYHYGRWADDPYYGWVWTPDTVWGPSWVCFREGGGYCGWAPLPPGSVFGASGELVIGAVPNDWFVFVGERHFGERIDQRSVIINNTTIINRTTINTKIRRENNRVIAEGPRVQDLQRVNHVRIQTGNVSTLRQREKAPPITHRAAPQPILQRQNEKPVERPAPEPKRETTPGKEPEIIRGTPSAPEPSPAERQRAEPPPAEKPQRTEPPAERREPVEQHPSEPPHGEKVAPSQHEKAPPQEQKGEQHDEQGQQKGEEQPGREH
jgi:hypothetical protein